MGGEGSHTYTPRNFKSANLTLSYNRSVMKRPGEASTPSPTEDGGPIMRSLVSEDTYVPKIASHTRSWPAVLARNYFRLNNIKLAVTFLINVILLTYQVTNLPALALATSH